MFPQVDKSYAVDKLSQLESDHSNFLDCKSNKSLTFDEFNAGFQARHDKISELKIFAIFQGHMMLSLASLDNNEQIMIVGWTTGDYNID